MKQLSKYAPLTMLVIITALLGLYFITDTRLHSTSHDSIEQQQKQFVTYVNSVQLQDKTPLLETSGPLCTKSSEHGETDCTLSKTFIYKLDGNFRDNGKTIFNYLALKGFDFSRNSKDEEEVVQKLHNTKLTDNLSNSEPIIVDLYNRQRNVRVRVNLGDYGRTIPDAKSPKLNQLAAGQLVAGIQFFNP